MKFSCFFIFLFISVSVYSCDCPPIQKIDSKKLKNYDVVFYGEVDSISSCNTAGISITYLTIKELYKGNVEANVRITFDCKSSCMMSFSKGDKWLIYGVYQRFDLLTVHFCGHSRKYFPDDSQDIYSVVSQQSFDEERNYLANNLGLQNFIHRNNNLNNKQNALKPHNNQPSGLNKILLLAISFIVMLAVYFFTRKKNKK